MIVVQQVVAEETVIDTVAVDSRSAAPSVFPDYVGFHGREPNQSVARLLADVAIHMNARGGVVVREIAANRGIHRTVALVDPVLIVVVRFVVPDQDVVGKRGKDTRERAVVNMVLTHRDTVRDSDVDRILWRIGHLE